MTNSIRQQIDARVQAFVTELSDMARAAALEAVQGALGGGSAPVRRGPGRPRGSGAGKKTAAPARPARRAKGARRSSSDVDSTANQLLTFVKSNDGKRLEEIARAMKVASADLKLPVKKLIAAKSLRTTGAKRGTKYHATGKSDARAKKA